MKTKTFKIATILVLASATAVFAHSGATGIVKERMESMKSIGAGMKVLGGMFAGKIEFSATSAQKAADVIADHGAKIAVQFPTGSDHKPTRAMAEIWLNKAEFDKMAGNLVAAAKTLAVKSAGAGNIGDIKAELIAVGGNCKACHKKFRAPEE